MLNFYVRNARTEIMKKFIIANEYKIFVPLFGAASAAPNKGSTIFTDLGLHQHC